MEVKLDALKRCARKLATAHAKVDPRTRGFFLVPHSKEVRLIEVTPSVATSGVVLPVRFRPDPERGIDYPSAILLLSPEEWTAVQSKQLRLPAGWKSWERLAVKRPSNGAPHRA